MVTGGYTIIHLGKTKCRTWVDLSPGDKKVTGEKGINRTRSPMTTPNYNLHQVNIYMQGGWHLFLSVLSNELCKKRFQKGNQKDRKCNGQNKKGQTMMYTLHYTEN